MPEANASQILDEVRGQFPGQRLEYANPSLPQCWPILVRLETEVVLVVVLISRHQIPRDLLPEERLCISQASRMADPQTTRWLYVSQHSGRVSFTWDPQSLDDTGTWQQ